MVDLDRLPPDSSSGFTLPAGETSTTGADEAGVSTPLTRAMAARNQTNTKVKQVKQETPIGVNPESPSPKLHNKVSPHLSPKLIRGAGKMDDPIRMLQKYCQLANEKERLKQIGAFENIRLYQKDREKALNEGQMIEFRDHTLDHGLVEPEEPPPPPPPPPDTESSTTQRGPRKTSEGESPTVYVNNFLTSPGNEDDKKVIRQYLLSSEGSSDLKAEVQKQLAEGKTEGANKLPMLVKAIKGEQALWKEVKNYLKSPLLQGTKLHSKISKEMNTHTQYETSPDRNWLNKADDDLRRELKVQTKLQENKPTKVIAKMFTSVGRALGRFFGAD